VRITTAFTGPTKDEEKRMTEGINEPGASAPVHAFVLPLWLDLLRHTLGARPEQQKANHGYRNRFCASVGSEHWLQFMAMVDAGFAETGSLINEGKQQFFSATVAGCKAIGLSRAAIKRAFAD
jgi:hypothetical protein